MELFKDWKQAQQPRDAGREANIPPDILWVDVGSERGEESWNSKVSWRSETHDAQPPDSRQLISQASAQRNPSPTGGEICEKQWTWASSPPRPEGRAPSGPPCSIARETPRLFCSRLHAKTLSDGTTPVIPSQCDGSDGDYPELGRRGRNNNPDLCVPSASLRTCFAPDAPASSLCSLRSIFRFRSFFSGRPEPRLGSSQQERETYRCDDAFSA